MTEGEALGVPHRCSILIVACQLARDDIEGLFLGQTSPQVVNVDSVVLGTVGIIGTIGGVSLCHLTAEGGLCLIGGSLTGEGSIAGGALLSIHTYGVR